MGREVSSVWENAGVLGKLFAKWFGNCTEKSGDAQTLVDNAISYAERYKLEAGLKRRHSRAGIRPTRAGWFVRDFPTPMGGPEWHLYQALPEWHLPAAFRVLPYRILESMPTSPPLKGPLRGSGLLHQYVARIQSLAQLLVEVWLTPTARYSNRVAITEVLTRAIEARYKMIRTGSIEKRESESCSSPGPTWPFNSVLDNVVSLRRSE